MSVRKCPKCEAVWDGALLKCAFCGIEGESQAVPSSYGSLLDRSAAAPSPQVELHEEPTEVAIAEATPVPPTNQDPAPVPAPEPVPVAVAEPVPPKPEAGVDRNPPAPRLPSAVTPFVFALLGLGALIVLPLVVFLTKDRTASVLAFLALSVLLPFGPFAWWAGRHYEDRCAQLGFRPAVQGHLGRRLGMFVTILLSFEGSVVAFVLALRTLGT